MASEVSHHSWRDSYRGMSSDNIKGLVLALSSSIFIGASFIVKKKGLKRAGASGVRAGVGGYSYLYEPLWWVGMITMVVGEVANFAAYAFAPAILVTPLGALSIIISAVLAHIILREKLHIFGILGCVLCVVGSTTIVLHAPQEREIESVKEVWDLATEPGFLLYAALVMTAVFVIIFHYIPQYGQTHIMCYIGVCSLVGSLSVMSVKAIGIALKLTLSGMNQLIYPQTWAFTLVVLFCVLTQMNYLNKVRRLCKYVFKSTQMWRMVLVMKAFLLEGKNQRDRPDAFFCPLPELVWQKTTPVSIVFYYALNLASCFF